MSMSMSIYKAPPQRDNLFIGKDESRPGQIDYNIRYVVPKYYELLARLMIFPISVAPLMPILNSMVLRCHGRSIPVLCHDIPISFAERLRVTF